jgi:hypothetical protein
MDGQLIKVTVFIEKNKRCLFHKLIICITLFCLGIPAFVLADNIRPAYLEIEELKSGTIRVVWKVPQGQGLPEYFAPSFPDRFRVLPPIKRLETGGSIIKTWNMVIEGGIVGAQIRIKGLKETTTDALVRIKMANGSVHRVVLRPTEPSTIIPDLQKTTLEQKSPYLLLLRFIDHWRYALLLSIALALSLFPAARRRGIALCTVALIAGALFGHTLGRLSIYDPILIQKLPSNAEAKKILQGLMLNTYRAFMLQKDEDVYDVLARSVSGEYLSEVYLQNREKMRIDDSDGAMAIVHRLDIKSINSMARRKGGRIAISANWDVYGSVYHRNHVHYRLNTYEAELIIIPTKNYWKLIGIQVLDEKRVL